MSPEQLQDMKDGEARPNLPRGRHCDYCRVYQQCRQWVQGKRPSARVAFNEFHQLRRQKRMPNQVPLIAPVPMAQHPIVIESGNEFARAAARVFPKQVDLGVIIEPPVKLPKQKKAG
jgi:hypothetical protein